MRLVAVVALLFGPHALAAEPLSLAEAQAEARSHAPEAAELRARLEGAEAVAADAHRIFRRDPTLSATFLSGAWAGRSEEKGLEASLSLPLEVSGAWTLRGASADADRDRSRLEREDGLRALDEAVAVAVAAVALSQRHLARSERLAELQAVGAEAARRELELGSSNRLDVDAAGLDLAAAQATVALARGELARARAELGRLLGRAESSGLAVQDPEEPLEPVAPVELERAVLENSRFAAAEAEVRAAHLQLAAEERSIWPVLTFSVGYGAKTSDIPAGSFRGPGAGGLSAQWSDSELGFGLSFPIPLLDRRSQARAQAHGRILSAEARLQAVRAQISSELARSRAALDAALEVVRVQAPVPRIVDRDVDLLERAMRAGAIDAVARAQALRRLEEAGRRADQAVFDLRVARARWERWAGAAPR